MIETYKYTHGLYNTNQDLLVREFETTTRGHSYKLKKRHCKSSLRQKFFSFRVVDSWNNLPSHVVNAPSLNSLDKVWQSHMYNPNINFPLRPAKIEEDETSDDCIDQLTGN